jgi:hypothetical protein
MRISSGDSCPLLPLFLRACAPMRGAACVHKLEHMLEHMLDGADVVPGLYCGRWLR